MSTRKPKPQVTKTVNGEILTALCKNCKCCLANDGHCWTDHVTKPISELCGCGSCEAQVNDYNERDAQRIVNRRVFYSTKTRDMV